MIDLLYNPEITQYFTDFAGCPAAFHRAFKQNLSVGVPIRSVLEIGVYHEPTNPTWLLPGQSTKALMILCDVYKVAHYVSIDINPDCERTITVSRNLLKTYGVDAPHKFVASDSLGYDVETEFPGGVDFVFLDSAHDANVIGGGAGTTYREISKYAQHLSKNGRLFLHDTKVYRAPITYDSNVEGAVRRFLAENPTFVFMEHNSNIYGLGEIFRKDSEIY